MGLERLQLIVKHRSLFIIMKLLLSFVFLFAISGICQAWWWDVKTVDKLDVDKYLGRWYEAYGSLVQKWTFQKNSFCTCANYGKRSDGKISVFNAGRKFSPTGKASNITGYAYIPDANVPGKLKVVFPRSGEGNYWVMKLGPLNAAGQYSYAIVTSNFKAFLWVLVRDHDEYMKTQDAEIQQWLKENGFTHFWNKPSKTYQGKDCLYPPEV